MLSDGEGIETDAGRRLSMQRTSILVVVLVTLWSGALAAPHRRQPHSPQPHLQQTPATFRITGAVEKPGEWTSEQLAKEFAGDIKTVSFTLKGEKGEARCVPLLILLQSARLHLDPKAKNHELAFVALVRAEDGYTIAFSLGELLPKFGRRQVWVALDRNGKPFTGDDAPVQLIVPEDEKGARWVHGIRSITLVDGFEILSKQKP